MADKDSATDSEPANHSVGINLNIPTEIIAGSVCPINMLRGCAAGCFGREYNSVAVAPSDPNKNGNPRYLSTY